MNWNSGWTEGLSSWTKGSSNAIQVNPSIQLNTNRKHWLKWIECADMQTSASDYLCVLSVHDTCRCANGGSSGHFNQFSNVHNCIQCNNLLNKGHKLESWRDEPWAPQLYWMGNQTDQTQAVDVYHQSIHIRGQAHLVVLLAYSRWTQVQLLELIYTCNLL
jgi:hypothetical protein